MCRKSIFGDFLSVKVPPKVPPNVFNFAICLFIRQVCVNSITPRDQKSRIALVHTALDTDNPR